MHDIWCVFKVLLVEKLRAVKARRHMRNIVFDVACRHIRETCKPSFSHPFAYYIIFGKKEFTTDVVIVVEVILLIQVSFVR